jgi:hypothetical protein
VVKVLSTFSHDSCAVQHGACDYLVALLVKPAKLLGLVKRQRMHEANGVTQERIDTVVGLAEPDDLFLFDLGYFKIQALTKIATAKAYFLGRINHQTPLLEAGDAQLSPMKLACCLVTVQSPSLEKRIWIGAQAQVAARLIAVWIPDAVVNTRRRDARKKAKKKGTHLPTPI